jgi:putative flippase GtrA
MISTAIGYAIAFIMNRKISFRADANVALSVFLYVLMVIFTIFANGWIGDNINTLFMHLNPALDAASNTTSALLQKIICMIIPTAWTYPCNRFIIHRKRKAKSS